LGLEPSKYLRVVVSKMYIKYGLKDRIFERLRKDIWKNLKNRKLQGSMRGLEILDVKYK
jgi:hypothetical protein